MKLYVVCWVQCECLIPCGAKGRALACEREGLGYYPSGGASLKDIIFYTSYTEAQEACFEASKFWGNMDFIPVEITI